MRTLVTTVALGTLVTSLVAPAQGSPPVNAPAGRPCSYAALSDVTGGSDAYTGQVNGGPLAWDRPFWLHCHLRVNAYTHATGSAAAHADAASWPHDADPATPEVVVLAERIDYVSPEDAYDTLCTSVSWPTATGPNRLYWTPATDGPDGLPGTSDDTAAHWSVDPNVACAYPRQYSTQPLFWVVDAAVREADARLCPAFAKAHGVLDPSGAGPAPGDLVYVDAEGDVFVDDGDGISEADWSDDLWWDCPGYTDWRGTSPQPGDDGYPVVDPGPPAGRPRSAVLGYVAVTMRDGDAQPAVTLAGVLAVPALWNCTSTPYVATAPFTVTCDPTHAADLGWDCGVLHADVTTTSPGAAARAELHCDADATPEVRTHTATGVGGHDSRVGPTLGARVVTRLRCTLTNGLGAAPVPGFAAGCGDPGAVRYE